MSKGPGHIQRAILELIAANPNGAWQTSELCDRVYCGEVLGGIASKAERVAVSRALRTMKLPGTWEIYRSCQRSGESWLCDPCNDESMIKQTRSEYCSSEARQRVLDAAARARRYRDGSPADRLTMDIEDLEYRAGYLATFAKLLNPEAAKGIPPVRARIEELKAQLAAMR